MIHFVATLIARPSQETAPQDALSGILGEVWAEPGCLYYELHRDDHDPSWFVMLET